ncbi:hypothetical protein GM415_17715 [Pseudodesulfovibrio cashew]|uniref:DNA-binding protein n=1 Tax=Pseudodesulfovibrio cashew TaxID=2678688 RepID=A0A6I6JLR8_9BACT|nr:hypothetical protein [Pseudodesulfovibrio cashew]QGY41880.1 hypothetical protein GM415_17715 [Pseudodesulfovibrio cashew]
MKNIPMKAMVAQCFSHCEALNAKAVYDLVRDHFPSEKYCSIPIIEDHLLSLKAVGILNEEGSYLDDDGQLVSVYRISEYGLDKLHRSK